MLTMGPQREAGRGFWRGCGGSVLGLFMCLGLGGRWCLGRRSGGIISGPLGRGFELGAIAELGIRLYDKCVGLVVL